MQGQQLTAGPRDKQWEISSEEHPHDEIRVLPTDNVNR